eukprot:scaffold1699_cov390-Prasinococcus_capsulatus_cf.AAC.1
MMMIIMIMMMMMMMGASPTPAPAPAPPRPARRWRPPGCARQPAPSSCAGCARPPPPRPSALRKDLQTAVRAELRPPRGARAWAAGPPMAHVRTLAALDIGSGVSKLVVARVDTELWKLHTEAPASLEPERAATAAVSSPQLPGVILHSEEVQLLLAHDLKQQEALAAASAPADAVGLSPEMCGQVRAGEPARGPARRHSP